MRLTSNELAQQWDAAVTTRYQTEKLAAETHATPVKEKLTKHSIYLAGIALIQLMKDLHPKSKLRSNKKHAHVLI